MRKEEIMLKFYYASEKTNSFRPTPWHLSEDPFPAYRGSGARYKVFQPFASAYKPEWDDKYPKNEAYSSSGLKAFDKSFSKLITTKKGTKLLLPCQESEDEKLMFCTLRGGFRGSFSRIEVVNGEILEKKSGNIHCCPTAHVIVRLKENGYLFTETGRRRSVGLIEKYSWEEYTSMPTAEFEAWQELFE